MLTNVERKLTDQIKLEVDRYAHLLDNLKERALLSLWFSNGCIVRVRLEYLPPRRTERLPLRSDGP